MITVTLLTVILVMIWATIIARLHWRQWGFITPFSGFLLASVLFVCPGFIYFYLFYQAAGFAQAALLNSVLGLGMAALGGVFAECALKRPRFVRHAPPFQAVRLGYSPTAYLFAGVVLASLVALYFTRLGYIPLFAGIHTLLTEGFVPGLLNTPRNLRKVYINPEAAYIPLQGLFEALRIVGMIMVILWFIHFYRIRLHRRAALVMILLAGFWLAATGQRWPILHLLIATLVYFSITTSLPQFRRILLKIAVLGLLIGVTLSALLARTSEQLTSLMEITSFGAVDLLGRILYGNAYAPTLGFEIFPKYQPWLYGKSYLQNLLSYLPGPAPSFPVTFYQMVTQDRRGFTAPPDFYTEAYLNFGYLGTATVSFLFGILLTIIGRMCMPLLRTLLGISVFSTMTLYLSLVSSNGLFFSLSWGIASLIAFGCLYIGQQFVLLVSCRNRFLRVSPGDGDIVKSYRSSC